MELRVKRAEGVDVIVLDISALTDVEKMPIYTEITAFYAYY
jgi:hypothetical protein